MGKKFFKSKNNNKKSSKVCSLVEREIVWCDKLAVCTFLQLKNAQYSF